MLTRPKIKICGITNLDDALAAVDAGADALGFNFCSQSPRFVKADVVRRIVAQLPPFVTAVGVFVNEDVKNVRDWMDDCGLALAQLHGDEAVAYCEWLARPVIKAIRLKDRDSLLALADYQGRARVRGFVLDAFSPMSYGGTGHVSNWELAAEAAKSVTVILAGGLTPENVTDAIRTVRPYGVDVSSGVESQPGKKDHAKLRAFINAVKLVAE
jgi:phosphoribosylanthranilate isomerase